MIPFGIMLFPLPTAELLHLVLCTSLQNIIIQTEHYKFWKYLFDIRIEVCLNLFWEYINGNLFAYSIAFSLSESYV
jgi:hypothetical protein